MQGNSIIFCLISILKQALRIRNTRIRHTIFNEHLVAMHFCKQSVKLDKPIFICQCLLDQSINLMNDFHCNKMLPYFTKDSLDLFFTDTDSLCYHVMTEDAFKYMLNNSELFDLSNYDNHNILYDTTNNKLLVNLK